MATCPHCAGGGLARIELSQATAKKLAEDRDSLGGRPWPRWLRALVFVAAFPVTVPSLVVSYAMAKRWGRVPMVAILVDGVIVVFLTLRVPALLAWATVAMFASLILVFRAWKQGRLERGIFFGYSNLVALPLIFGGAAAVVGLLAGLPGSFLRRASLATAEVTDYRLGEVCESMVPVPKVVRLRDARLDGDHRGRFEATPPAAHPGGASFVLVPVLPAASPRDGRTSKPCPLWLVASQEAPLPSGVEGLLWRPSLDLWEKFAGAAGKHPAGTPPSGGLELVLLADASTYDAFGVVEPTAPVGWGWLALAGVGFVLVGLATWRATEEDEEL